MNTAIFTTAYLPPVEYFYNLLHYSINLIENDEHYARQTYRNRCVISGPNGLQVLSIPVLKTHSLRLHIKDVKINQSSRWRSVHWRSIEAAYNKSPFFLYYRDEFQVCFSNSRTYLLDLNMDFLMLCINLLKISVDISYTEKFYKVYADDTDLRYILNPKNKTSEIAFPRYPQVFENLHGFIPNLGIIDLLFNRGPDAKDYLQSLKSL